MSNQKPSFRFEIKHFSKKEFVIVSHTFMSGGCKWFLGLLPKGRITSLYLYLADPNPLESGWETKAKFYFVVSNKSNKELYRSSTLEALFDTKNTSYRSTLPLDKKLQEGVLEDDILIIEVYIDVIDDSDNGEGEEDVSEKEETVEDINGFKAFANQVNSARKRFTERVVKKEYMNVLSNACSKVSELAEEGFKMDWFKSKLEEISLKMKKSDESDGNQIQQLEERVKDLEMLASLIKEESLERKRHNLEMMASLESKLEEVSLERKRDGSRLDNLESDLKKFPLDFFGHCIQNLEQGLQSLGSHYAGLDFETTNRLAFLESKLEEVSLERKRDASRFQSLEESVMYLESQLDEASWERKRAEDADGSRLQTLEESVKNLEIVAPRVRLESLESKLKEVSFERKREEDAFESRFQTLEESVEVRLESLESKLDEASLERKIAEDADGSRFHILEKSVKNLEMMAPGVRLETLESKLEEVSLERKRARHADGCRFHNLEESVKDLELMSPGPRLAALESTLDEVSLEKKKSDDAFESQIQQLEKHIKKIAQESQEKLESMETKLEESEGKLESMETSLEESEERLDDMASKLEESKERLDSIETDLEESEERLDSIETDLEKSEERLDSMETKLEEASLERKESNDTDKSRFQNLEESLKSLEMMVADLKAELSNLKVEQDEEKFKSFSEDAEFFLVDKAT